MIGIQIAGSLFSRLSAPASLFLRRHELLYWAPKRTPLAARTTEDAEIKRENKKEAQQRQKTTTVSLSLSLSRSIAAIAAVASRPALPLCAARAPPVRPAASVRPGPLRNRVCGRCLSLSLCAAPVRRPHTFCCFFFLLVWVSPFRLGGAARRRALRPLL